MRKWEVVYSRDADEAIEFEEILADKCNVMQSGAVVFTVGPNVIKILSSFGFVSVTPGDIVEEIRGVDGRPIDIEIAN